APSDRGGEHRTRQRGRPGGRLAVTPPGAPHARLAHRRVLRCASGDPLPAVGHRGHLTESAKPLAHDVHHFVCPFLFLASRRRTRSCRPYSAISASSARSRRTPSASRAALTDTVVGSIRPSSTSARRRARIESRDSRSGSGTNSDELVPEFAPPFVPDPSSRFVPCRSEGVGRT